MTPRVLQYTHTTNFFFLIGIQSTQGWAATKKDRSTKKAEKDEMYKANLIRESQNIIGA